MAWAAAKEKEVKAKAERKAAEEKRKARQREAVRIQAHFAARLAKKILHHFSENKDSFEATQNTCVTVGKNPKVFKTTAAPHFWTMDVNSLRDVTVRMLKGDAPKKS